MPYLCIFDQKILKLDIFGQKYPKKAWLIADINIFFFFRETLQFDKFLGIFGQCFEENYFRI